MSGAFGLSEGVLASARWRRHRRIAPCAFFRA
jgi:hypothetical protein